MGILKMFGDGEFKPQQSLAPKIDYSLLPKTGREYDPNIKLSYEEQMRVFEEKAMNGAYSGGFVRCGTHGQGKIIFACKHCHEQDPVHPNGIVFTPFRYFLCMKCYGDYKLSKLNLGTDLCVICMQCILDQIEKIKKIDPTKVVDLNDGKTKTSRNVSIWK